MKTWMEVLFDEDDNRCLVHEPTATRVYPSIEFVGFHSQLVPQFTCINPLAAIDNEPTQEWHHPDQGRRADANVTKFRTILVEFDSIPLEQQAQYVIEQMQMPYSVMTFSGGKSFHFLISLVEPCADKKDYAQLAARVYKALGGHKAGLDEANKNPSRLSRTPNAMRDNGVKQELVEVRDRISREHLEGWLELQGQGRHTIVEKKFTSKPKLGPNWKAPLSGHTLSFLMFGAPEGTWNQRCFKAACDMVRSGYTEDEIFVRMERDFGYLETSAISTIKSAVRRAEADGE